MPQPPSLTSVTVIGADASQLALNESTGTANVALTTNVRASFSPSLDPASIDDSAIIVVDAQTGSAVGGKAAGDATGVTWSITPGQRLKNNARTTSGRISVPTTSTPTVSTTATTRPSAARTARAPSRRARTRGPGGGRDGEGGCGLHVK